MLSISLLSIALWMRYGVIDCQVSVSHNTVMDSWGATCESVFSMAVAATVNYCGLLLQLENFVGLCHP